MTQTASVDRNAGFAFQAASSSSPARQGGIEFNRALDEADRQTLDAPRPEAPRPDGSHEVTQRERDERSNETRQSERAAQRADDSRAAHAVRDDRAAPPRSPNASEANRDASASKPADAPTAAKDADASAASASSHDAKKPGDGADATAQAAQPPAPTDAQAMLALLLAAGAQVKPDPTPAIPQASAATAAVADLAAGKHPSADDLLAGLKAAQAQAQAQTPDAAKAAAQAPVADAAGLAKTPIPAQLAALLAQAGKNLGPITAQVTQTVTPAQDAAKPAAVAEAPKAAPKAEGPVSLLLQLLGRAKNPAEAAAAQNNGSNTQATKLDGATGTGIPSQAATRLTEALSTAKPKAAEADLLTPAVLANGHAHGAAGANSLDTHAEAALHAPKASDVMPQILDQIERVKANQTNSLKLQLYPEHLGKMEIKVSSHLGFVSATLTADSPHVKTMLEGQVAQLQQTFADMGLKVDKVVVTLSSANLDFNGSGSTPQGQDQTPNRQQQASSQPNTPGYGYDSWRADEPGDTVYAPLDASAAIDYVA